MLPIPSGLALLRTLVTKVVSRVSQLKINQDRKEANATTKGKKTKAKTQKKAAPKKPAKKKAEKVCKRPAKKIKKPAAAPPAHPADIQNEGEEESSVAEDPELTEDEAEAAAAPSTKNKAPEAKAKAKGKAPKAKAKGKAKKDTKSSKDRGSPKPKKKGKELSEAEPLACSQCSTFSCSWFLLEGHCLYCWGLSAGGVGNEDLHQGVQPRGHSQLQVDGLLVEAWLRIEQCRG